MILVYTYVDEKDGKTYIDFGVEMQTERFVLLPNEELDVQRMGLIWEPTFEHWMIP